MNRKFLITFVVLLSIIIGLWIWTLAIPKHVIDIGGSSSVDPLMQKITNKYQKEKKKKFIYSSTGSNTGVTNLIKNVYEIAFVSKDVPTERFPDGITEIVASDFLNDQGQTDETAFLNHMAAKGDGYFYLNFTNDPIVFIYNSQNTGLSPQIMQNIRFILSGDNELSSSSKTILKQIYEHDDPIDLVSWFRLVHYLPMPDIDVGELAKVNKNLWVQPYSSTPGSGTWTSFQQITGGVTPGEAVNKYGNNGSIFYQVSKSPGAFGFVSMGYAQSISKYKYLQSVIIEKGSQLWDVKTQGNNSPSGPYPLTRPFNALFKNKANQDRQTLDILKFIFWFATNPELKQIYSEEGLFQNFIATNQSLNFYLSLHINELYQLENWHRGRQWH